MVGTVYYCHDWGVGHPLKAPEDLLGIICPAGIMVGSVLSGAHLGWEAASFGFLHLLVPRLAQRWDSVCTWTTVPGVLGLSDNCVLRAAALSLVETEMAHPHGRSAPSLSPVCQARA